MDISRRAKNRNGRAILIPERDVRVNHSDESNLNNNKIILILTEIHFTTYKFDFSMNQHNLKAKYVQKITIP